MRKQIKKKQDAAKEEEETLFCCSAFRTINRWKRILYGKSFNLKTICKAILATLERIIRLFSQKWPKPP
jgi:hypothetical protein